MAPEDPSIISPTRPTRISRIFPDTAGIREEVRVSPGHRTLLPSLLDSLAGHAAAFGGLHALDGLLIVVTAGVLWARSHGTGRGEPG